MKDNETTLLSDAYHIVLHQGGYLALVPRVGILEDKQHLKRAQDALRGIDTGTTNGLCLAPRMKPPETKLAPPLALVVDRITFHSRSVLSGSYLAATENEAVTHMHILDRACNILVNKIALKHIS